MAWYVVSLNLSMVHVVKIITGTKNVVKGMKKICSGTVANRNKSWFTELSGYVPKRKLLSDPAAIRALEGALKRTSIYRYAAHYCRVRCFSFSLQLLFDVTTNSYI